MQRFSERFSEIVEWISAGLSKLHSECPLGTFSRKYCFWERICFISFLQNDRESFSPCVEVLYGGLSKSPSTCPMGHFEGFIFFQFAFFLFQFRTLMEKFYAISENIPTELSKLIPDACPRVNIGESIFNRNIVLFILFGKGAKKFRPFDKFFKAEFWKLHSTCPQKQFENFFAKKTYFHHFWNSKEKNYAFFFKSIGGVVKTALYLSTGTFRGDLFTKKTLFYRFRMLLESCSTSSVKVSAGLSKFVTTCP